MMLATSSRVLTTIDLQIIFDDRNFLCGRGVRQACKWSRAFNNSFLVHQTIQILNFTNGIPLKQTGFKKLFLATPKFPNTVKPLNTADLGTGEKAAVFRKRGYWESYITYKTLIRDLKMVGGIGREAVLGGQY